MTPRQLLQIPMTGGLDEKTSPKYLSPGAKSAQVINGVWRKNGTLEKRRGYVGLTQNYFQTVIANANTGILIKGTKLLGRSNEVLVCDGASLYSYSSGASYFARKNGVSTCVATRTSVAQTTSSIASTDVAEGNGFRVFVWIGDNNVVYASVLDTSTGAYLYQSFPVVQNGATIAVAVIVVGTRAIVFYDAGAADQHLFYKFLNLAAPTAGWSSQQTLTANRRASSICWDVSPTVGNANEFICVYDGTASSNSLVISRQQWGGSSFTQVNSTTITESLSSPSYVSVRSTAGEVVWVTYRIYNAGITSDVVKFAAYNPTSLAQVLAPASVSVSQSGQNQSTPAIERVDATHAVICWYGYGGATPGVLSWCQVNTAGGVTGANVRTNFQAGPLTRPFVVNGHAYVMCKSSDQTNATLCVVDLAIEDSSATLQCREVARIAPRFASPAIGFRLSNATGFDQASPTKITCVSAIATGAAVAGRQGMTQITLDFAHPGLLLGAQIGGSLYLAGGVPSIYDGQLVTEIGFSKQFVTPGAPTRSSTGGSMTGGSATDVYGYCFVYEWTNESGERVQSAPSIPTLVDLSANPTYNTTTCSVAFSLGTIGLTAKQYGDRFGAIGIVPYRTTAGGTVYYRVVPDAIPIGLQNSTNVGTISWTDTATDISINQNPILYTTGNVIENDCPSSFAAIAVHKSRVFGVGDDLRTIWFSTAWVPGQQVRFNDTFQLSMPETITALASMEDKLVVFGQSSIYVVYGDGPPETGAGSDFQVSPRLPSDVGCIDPRSVVVSPDGVYFQGAQGIYLLDRSLAVQWVGKNVVDELTTYPVITSAVLVPEQNQIRWTVTTADGTQGEVLVYDTAVGEWATHVVADPANMRAPNGHDFVCGAEVSGVYYLLAPGGVVHQERAPADAAAYLDAGATWVPLTWASPYIHLAGLDGFKRVRNVQLQGEYTAAHAMTIVLDYDFGYTDWTYAFTDSQVAAMAAQDGREEVQIRAAFNVARCTAIQVTLTDAAPTVLGPGNGQGARWTNLLIEWIPKQGAARLGAANKW